MNEAEFLDILKQPEGETLDFKQQRHDFTTSQGKGEFIKDVLAMANTPRDRSSYIVLGVRDSGQGQRDLMGIAVDFDEVSLQDQLRDRVYPIPVCRLSVVNYDGKDFGIIEIPPERMGPCVPVKTSPELKLAEGQVHFRRGSRNDVAKAADLQRILAWIHGQGVADADNRQVEVACWPEFIESVGRFEPNRRYVLIAHPFDGDIASSLAPLGKIPWSAVFDFDPSSDTTGLLAALSPALGAHRSIRTATAGNHPNINFDNSTYWFFARGFAGRDDTVELGTWRRWVNRYQLELTNQLNRIAASLSPSPVTCIVLWRDNSLVNHVDTTLQSAYGAFGDALETVFVNGDNVDVSIVAAKHDAKSFVIPWRGFSRGIDAAITIDSADAVGKCLLPGSHGEPVQISHDTVLWLREELELVDLGAGRVLPQVAEVRREFLRGTEISWFALGAHCDVDRDKANRLKTKVETELRTRRTSRVNLYHAPGGGGTTVAKGCSRASSGKVRRFSRGFGRNP